MDVGTRHLRSFCFVAFIFGDLALKFWNPYPFEIVILFLFLVIWALSFEIFIRLRL